MVPVEVSGRLIEAVPAVVDKVPPAAERVRREIVLARFLGKLAVDQGAARASFTTGARRRAADRVPVRGDSTASPGARTPRWHQRTEPDEVPRRPSRPRRPFPETLALADYDHLSSAQVISKLAGLDGTELDAIEAYERSSRHRRTILGKIDQLRSSEGRIVIDPTVRLARAADADQLSDLELEARAALVGQRGGDRWLVEHPAIDGAWSRCARTMQMCSSGRSTTW